MAGMMDVALPDPNEAEAAPSDNLYVSDLPAATTEDSLRAMFGPGVVQCRVLPSKTLGQGTVALVRFSSTKEAILVRETLNGAIPPGQQRPVTIRFCGSKPEAGKAGGAAAGAGGAPSYTKAVIAAAAHAARQSPYGAGACGGKGSVAAQAQAAEAPQPNDNLYVTGLPPGIDNASLLGLFSQYGQVVQCKVLPSPNEGMPPHALVRFSSMDEAAAVKKSLTGYALEGVNEPLVIEFALQKSKKDEGWGGKGGMDSSAGKGSWDGGKGSEGGWDGGKGNEGGWDGKGGSEGWGGKGGNDGGWGGKGGNDGGWGGKGGNDGWGGKGGSEGWGGKGGNDGSWGGGKGFDDGSKGSWGGGKGFDESGKGGSKGSWGSSKGFDESSKGGYGGSWGGKGYEEQSGAGGWGGQGGAEEEDGSAKGKGAGKAGGGKAAAASKSGGKVDRTQFTPEWGGMDRIIQGFVEAQCLPGHKLGNEDNCLFVSGLPKDCDDVHLYRLLAPFGAITPTGVKAMKHPDGACKGFGFVNFVEHSAMEAAALMLHGTQLPDGSALSVVPKKSKKDQGRKGAGKTVPPREEQQEMLG